MAVWFGGGGSGSRPFRRREVFRGLPDLRGRLDELRDEIHFQRLRQPEGRAEGDVDVTVQHLRHVGSRDVQAPGQRGLVQPQRLHLQKDGAQELGDHSVGGGHWAIVYLICYQVARGS